MKLDPALRLQPEPLELVNGLPGARGFFFPTSERRAGLALRVCLLGDLYPLEAAIEEFVDQSPKGIWHAPPDTLCVRAIISPVPRHPVYYPMRLLQAHRDGRGGLRIKTAMIYDEFPLTERAQSMPFWRELEEGVSPQGMYLLPQRLHELPRYAPRSGSKITVYSPHPGSASRLLRTYDGAIPKLERGFVSPYNLNFSAWESWSSATRAVEFEWRQKRRLTSQQPPAHTQRGLRRALAAR